MEEQQGQHSDWRATRLFVSHSHADNAFGMLLVTDLRRILGAEDAVWYDAAGGLQGGDAWWRTIREELAARPVFVVLVSPASMDSIWVNNEIDMAWAQRNATRDAAGRPAGKRILPLLVGPVTLRADLATLHDDTITFLPPATYEASLRALLDRLGVPPGAEHAAPSRPAEPAPSEGSFVLRHEPLAPHARQGISRRTVLAVGGTLAAAAVVGGFADLLLAHGTGRQGTLGTSRATATTATTAASGTPRAGSRVRWQTPPGVYTGGQNGQLVATADGRTLCFGTAAGAYALDVATGTQKWAHTPANLLNTGGSYLAQAANDIIVLGAVVYEVLPVRTIYGLHVSDGSVAWQQGTQAQPLGLTRVALPPQPSEVYALQVRDASSPDFQVTGGVALRTSDGAVLGTTGKSIASGMWASNGDVTITPGGAWYAYDASTLQQRWVVTSGPGTADFSRPQAFILVGQIGYCLTADGYVTALRATDASLIWEARVIPDLATTLPSDPFTLLTSGNVLVVVLSDGRIYALDTATGRMNWSTTASTGGGHTYSLQFRPTIDGKSLYVPGDNGFLYAYDLQHAGETRWVAPQVNSFACAPVVAGDLVCAADSAGVIYAFATD